MGGNVGHHGGRRSRTTAIPRGYDASSSPIEPYRVLSPCGGGPEGRPATGSNVLQVTVDPLPVGRYAVGRRRVSNVPRTPPAMGGDPGKVATRHRPHIHQVPRYGVEMFEGNRRDIPYPRAVRGPPK